MKTSVVLLALATAALAAPALHEETIDEPKIPAKFLEAFTRERKSLESTPGAPVHLPSPVSEFGVTGRTFNLKKPIIIKKNVGSSYQVYRDSDEEKQDSAAPCRKQVRVSLCDEQNLAKSADMMRSSTNEDPSTEMAEKDMKQSILLAKQAIENVQKDLKNVEEPAKTAPWKHGESDAELHQDIEKARQVMEHIHNTFDNLEASNSETLKEAEVAEDVTIPLGHTEEERLAQWKDAIEKIQRNVELVRNIEDSFKSTHDDMTHHNEPATSMKDDKKHELHEQLKHEMRVPEHLKEENKPLMEHKEHSTFEHSEHPKFEKSSEQNDMKTVKVENDMLESASMVSASKLQTLSHDDKETLSPEHITKAKESIDMKMANQEERKTETEKTKENKPEDLFTKKRKSIEEDDSLNKQNITHDQTMSQKEMKSAELINEQHAELIKDEDKTHEGHHIIEKLSQATGFTKENTEFPENHNKEKMARNENSMFPASSSDSMTVHHHTMTGHNLEMKEAEQLNNKHHQQHEQHQMRWTGDKDLNSEMGMMKSAAHPMDHSTQMHSGHQPSHLHALQHVSGHHIDTTHAHLRHHDHFTAHGKSADMNDEMQNFYMNMRDSEQDGHRFRWRPSHMPEAARSAYGAPASSAPSSGAIGLFPNANVGGCGIPLLLSCNPSVVSGSLAKAHPAPYSAPAYRTEDDFNVHHKRDVKKTENIDKALNRAPVNPILKSTVLVAKQ